MYTFITDFLSSHLVLPALLISGAWFYCGYRDFQRGRRFAGIGWQFIGVLILVAFGISMVRERAWFSVMIVLLAGCTEVWLIRRVLCEGQSVPEHSE